MPGRTWFRAATQRWKTLQHVTASPGKVGKIAQAALVLVLFEVGGWLHTRDQLAEPAGLAS